MRTLGDASWINDYVGVPYAPGGRDMAGMDCYGLLVVLFDQEMGMQLPDWQSPAYDDLRERAELIQEVVDSPRWEAREIPEDFDIAVVRRSRLPHHVGVVLAGGVLHASQADGVIFEPMTRFVAKYQAVEFGTWPV